MNNKLIIIATLITSIFSSASHAMEHKRSIGNDFEQQTGLKRARLTPEQKTDVVLAQPTVRSDRSSVLSPLTIPSPSSSTHAHEPLIDLTTLSDLFLRLPETASTHASASPTQSPSVSISSSSSSSATPSPFTVNKSKKLPRKRIIFYEQEATEKKKNKNSNGTYFDVPIEDLPDNVVDARSPQPHSNTEPSEAELKEAKEERAKTHAALKKYKDVITHYGMDPEKRRKPTKKVTRAIQEEVHELRKKTPNTEKLSLDHIEPSDPWSLGVALAEAYFGEKAHKKASLELLRALISAADENIPVSEDALTNPSAESIDMATTLTSLVHTPEKTLEIAIESNDPEQVKTMLQKKIVKECLKGDSGLELIKKARKTPDNCKNGFERKNATLIKHMLEQARREVEPETLLSSPAENTQQMDEAADNEHENVPEQQQQIVVPEHKEVIEIPEEDDEKMSDQISSSSSSSANANQQQTTSIKYEDIQAAIEEGDSEQLKSFLQQDPTLFKNHKMLLHFALKRVKRFQNEIIKTLLAHGVNPNEKNSNGATPLHIALQTTKISPATIKMLLAYTGLSLNVKDNEGSYPIHTLITGPHWKKRLRFETFFSVLTDTNKKIVLQQKNDQGKTALDLAYELQANKKDQDIDQIVSTLEQCHRRLFGNIPTRPSSSSSSSSTQAVSTLPTAQQITAPIIATSSSSASTVSIAPTQHISMPTMPLMAPQQQSFMDINAVIDQTTGRTRLHQAVTNSTIDVVINLLLRDGANFNAKDNNGWTALHCAALKNQAVIAQILIAGNRTDRADINAPTNHGATALMVAADHGSLDVVRLLLTYGANINAKDVKGWTALHHFAAQKITAQKNQDIIDRIMVSQNQATIAQLLITGNGTGRADINATTNHGTTPLMVAAEHGLSGIVHTLLIYGANINAKQNTGWTALHFSAQKNQAIIVQLLITGNITGRAGINATTNHDIITPLIVAVEHGSLDVVRLLLTYGATNTKALTKNNMTAYDAVLKRLKKLGQSQTNENQTTINQRNNYLAVKALLEQHGAGFTGAQILAHQEAVRIAAHAYYSSVSMNAEQKTPTTLTVAEAVNTQQATATTTTVNQIWSEIVNALIEDVCVKTLKNYNKTADKDMIEIIKNQLQDVLNSFGQIHTKDELVRAILPILTNNLSALINEADSSDFYVDFESALRQFFRRNDIAAKLEPFLQFKLKAAALYLTIIRKRDDDHDATGSALALLTKKLINSKLGLSMAPLKTPVLKHGLHLTPHAYTLSAPAA